MGCCFSPPKADEDQEVPNNSKLIIAVDERPVFSPNTASLHREKGKKYFNSGSLELAQKEYQLALQNDPDNFVNYTNLALTQKALHMHQQSIVTIERMEIRSLSGISNLSIFVKGKILKARCQSILAKNYCVGDTSPSIEEREHALKMINDSVTGLERLLESKEQREIAKSMNIDKYLDNSLKVKHILFQVFKEQKSESDLFNYLNKRLASKQSGTSFKEMGLNKYATKPEDVIKIINEMSLKAKKEQFNDDEEEQEFTIDPITYELYKVPILLKSGLTYEESILKSHYEKNGSYDPITKEKFTDQLGVVNRTLIAYIQQTKKIQKMKAIMDLDL